MNDLKFRDVQDLEGHVRAHCQPNSEQRFKIIAATYDATAWFSQAAEECAELAAAIGKLNRTLGCGLSTPTDFETAYDAVIEEMVDAVDTLETAFAVLNYQRRPDPEVPIESVPIVGPLHRRDREYMARVITMYKHNRFVERNSDRLGRIPIDDETLILND